MTYRQRGSTLAELIITAGIFSFLMVSIFTIMRMGTDGWRDLSDKGDVQRTLRHFESDITQELKRASLASVGIYTPSNDYRWAIFFKTAMNDHDVNADG